MVVHTSSQLKTIMAAVVAGMFCTTASGAGESVSAKDPFVRAAETDYQRWVARYGRTNQTAFFNVGKAEPLRLVVTTVEGGESLGGRERRSRLGSGVFTHGAKISIHGEISYFSHSDFGSRGSSGGPPLSAGALMKLDALLGNLPDDESCLPPGGRRLLLQGAVGGHWVTRVYDRANAPDKVWEILRLGRCGVVSWVPQFEPQSEIDARGFEHDGFLAVSPNGQRILFRAGHGPLQLWEPTTHEFLAEIHTPGMQWNCITFSPDGSLAVMGGSECVCVNTKDWKTVRTFKELRSDGGFYTLSFAQFTPDRRFLLLQCNKPSLEVYDTETWQPVKRLPQVPDDAVQYLPSPMGKCALARLKSGVVVLWDIAQRRQMAVLDENVFLSQVSFAPDSSLVAAATAQSSGYLSYWGAPRIRVWNTDNGELVHELRPFERAAYGRIEGLAWSPDGRYVLAATKPDGFFTSRSISVFNVKTGRHRGDFTGCPSAVNGLALLPGAGQIVAGCQDGRIRFWDFANGLKAIQAFEASLRPVKD